MSTSHSVAIYTKFKRQENPTYEQNFGSILLRYLSLAAQTQAGGSESKASFEKWIEQANKAQTSNDANWMEVNLANGYVEGTSFGTYISKSQLIKDANDPANNKFLKRYQ